MPKGVMGRVAARAKINKMFKGIDKGVKDEGHRRFVKMAKDTIQVAIKNAPVKTGYLVGSAFFEAPTQWKGDKLLVRMGFRANYARVVEERHRTRGFYLKRAIDEVWDKSPKFDTSRALKQNIKRIVIDV